MIAVIDEHAGERGVALAAGALGFALGGFFDGILLHQILQWHHLLSLVPGETLQQQTTQILADGLFHALMYVIALIGLFALWRRRTVLARLPGRQLAGAALLGFGLWHVLDISLVHWLLGWHRTRLDTDLPMAWDLLWLGLFGAGALALGRRLARAGGGRSRRAAVMLTLLVVGTGVWAAWPPRDQPVVLAVFAPGRSAFAAAVSLGGTLVSVDRSGRVAAVALADPGDASRLYGRGALWVAPSAASGCLAWTRMEQGDG